MPKVAIVQPPSAPWIASCLEGIRRYANTRGDWHLLSTSLAFRGRGDSLNLADMKGWKGDGIIGLIDEAKELRRAKAMGIAIVNLGSRLPEAHGIPRVMVNHFQGGRLAAEHLLKCGVRHLALFGWKGAWYANQRRLGFMKRAAEAGIECHSHLWPYMEKDGTKKTWMQRIIEPARWLATLPRPCGVFAIHDYMAQLLMEACTEAGMKIPDDIALMGMDNDLMIGEHSAPKLTSVSRNSERVGWEAAALLDRMMRGEAAPGADLLVEPDGVVARQSTERWYCEEPVLQRALDFMRAHLSQPFNIDHLAAHAGVSKRTLEIRCREQLQSSPHQLVIKLRIEYAKELLLRPGKLSIEKAAAACGFGSAQAFQLAFRRMTGKTPGAFRRKEMSSPQSDGAKI